MSRRGPSGRYAVPTQALLAQSEVNLSSMQRSWGDANAHDSLGAALPTESKPVSAPWTAQRCENVLNALTGVGLLKEDTKY